MIGAPNEAWTRRKMAAKKYAPNRMRLLLVAEGPPEDATSYFYFEDPKSIDRVFESVCEVLFEEKPAGAKVPFLKELKRRGIFLVELKPDAPRADEKLAPYVPPFLINLDTLAPEKIILLGEDVHTAAARAVEKAGLPLVDAKVPAPGSSDAAVFRNKFRQALVRGDLEKLIKPLSPKARGA